MSLEQRADVGHREGVGRFRLEHAVRVNGAGDRATAYSGIRDIGTIGISIGIRIRIGFSISAG
jgi:hypothetical protein